MLEHRETALLLHALADEHRLRIIATLAGDAELSVRDLTLHLRRTYPSLSQPLISWHLRVLRKRELIRMRREGRQVFYALDRRRWHLLRDMMEALVVPHRLDTIITGYADEGHRPPLLQS